MGSSGEKVAKAEGCRSKEGREGSESCCKNTSQGDQGGCRQLQTKSQSPDKKPRGRPKKYQTDIKCVVVAKKRSASKAPDEPFTRKGRIIKRPN